MSEVTRTLQDAELTHVQEFLRMLNEAPVQPTVEYRLDSERLTLTMSRKELLASLRRARTAPMSAAQQEAAQFMEASLEDVR